VRYFGLAPEIDLAKNAEVAIAQIEPDMASSARLVFDDIRSQDRITAKPHVTLVHEKNVQAEKEAADEGAVLGPQETLWNTCKALAETEPSPLFDFNMTHLVWDDRVMALVIDDLHPQQDADRGKASPLNLPPEVRAGLHVTVGTRRQDISAFESRGITRFARSKIAEGIMEGEADEVVECGGKIRWAMIGPIRGEGRVRGMS
jgi:tRNA ligase